MKLKLIVAMCKNMGIGFNNNIPWKIKQDLIYFSSKTCGLYGKYLKNKEKNDPKTFKDIKNIKMLFRNFDYVMDSENKIYKTKLVYPQKNKMLLPGSDHLGLYSKLSI